jgi:hypothetical protein
MRDQAGNLDRAALFDLVAIGKTNGLAGTCSES